MTLGYKTNWMVYEDNSGLMCIWNIHIYLSWYKIPDLAVYIRIFLIDRSLPKRKLVWIKGSLWLSWSHHFESFTITIMTLQCNCVPDDHGHIPFVVVTILSFMTNYRIFKSNMMGGTKGAGTTYSSIALDFTPSFKWDSCYLILIYLS